MRHKGIFAEILDPWSAASVFADAHGRPWSAGEAVPLDFSRVMERLETSRIHDVLADFDEQLALAVSAESLDSLSAGGKYTPLSLPDGARGSRNAGTHGKTDPWPAGE